MILDPRSSSQIAGRRRYGAPPGQCLGERDERERGRVADQEEERQILGERKTRCTRSEEEVEEEPKNHSSMAAALGGRRGR